MMTFAHPTILLLLAAPILLAAWELSRRGHVIALPFDHIRPRPRRWLHRLVLAANLLPPLLLGVAILVLAGPQQERTAESKREMSNIQFVLDVSGSMESPFGEGTRYDAAMNAITEFTTYRKGDAFGLTVFGTEVLHWVPLTKDLSAIQHATPFLKPDNWPAYMGGTLIGKALRECQTLLMSRPEGDRMLVLVTDGYSADLGGAAGQQIAAELAAERIAVYIIIVGEGMVPNEMQTIASLTGGELFNVGDPAALKSVFQRIDRMKQARLTPPAREFADLFWPLAIVGLSLAGLYGLCAFGLRYTPW